MFIIFCYTNYNQSFHFGGIAYIYFGFGSQHPFLLPRSFQFLPTIFLFTSPSPLSFFFYFRKRLISHEYQPAILYHVTVKLINFSHIKVGKSNQEGVMGSQKDATESETAPACICRCPTRISSYTIVPYA